MTENHLKECNQVLLGSGRRWWGTAHWRLRPSPLQHPLDTYCMSVPLGSYTPSLAAGRWPRAITVRLLLYSDLLNAFPWGTPLFSEAAKWWGRAITSPTPQLRYDSKYKAPCMWAPFGGLSAGCLQSDITSKRTGATAELANWSFCFFN